MNILRVCDKLPLQRDFFNNSAGNLLTALRFPGGLYNFFNFIIIFYLMQVTMICRRGAYFMEMVEYYPKYVRLK